MAIGWFDILEDPKWSMDLFHFFPKFMQKGAIMLLRPFASVKNA